VKGIGESGSIGAPPTIVHAVLDALAPFGIAHLDMPLTPKKIWAAIQSARAEGNRHPHAGVREETPPPRQVVAPPKAGAQSLLLARTGGK
jgi:hypothetical protein